MIRLWFLAMKKIRSIGGCVGVLLLLALSASDGYCWPRLFQRKSTPVSQSAPVPNGTPQNTGNAVAQAMQSPQTQQLMAQANSELRRSKSLPQPTSNSAEVLENEQALALQRQQSIDDANLRIATLRNQLNQEEANLKSLMAGMSTSERVKIKAAQMKESIQNKASQIFSGLKSGASNLGGKIKSGASSFGGKFVSGVKSGASSLKNGVSKLGGKIKSGASGLGSKIKSGTSSLKNKFSSLKAKLFKKKQATTLPVDNSALLPTEPNVSE